MLFKACLDKKLSAFILKRINVKINLYQFSSHLKIPIIAILLVLHIQTVAATPCTQCQHSRLLGKYGYNGRCNFIALAIGNRNSNILHHSISIEINRLVIISSNRGVTQRTFVFIPIRIIMMSFRQLDNTATNRSKQLCLHWQCQWHQGKKPYNKHFLFHKPFHFLGFQFCCKATACF